MVRLQKSRLLLKNQANEEKLIEDNNESVKIFIEDTKLETNINIEQNVDKVVSVEDNKEVVTEVITEVVTEVITQEQAVIIHNENIEIEKIAAKMKLKVKNPDELHGNPGGLARFNHVMSQKQGNVSKYFGSRKG